MEDDLLKDERRILKRAQEILDSQENRDDHLVKELEKLTKGYQKLLMQFDKILKIGDSHQNFLLRKKQRLEDISFIDGLTGVPNRRRFDGMLTQKWETAQQREEFLSLIMLDIDFFKEYNDSYGHLKGDDCLKEIANVLSNKANNPEDFVARYGGEEFVLIFSNTNQEEAAAISEEIRVKIEDLQIPHNQSDISEYVTVSLGSATIIPNEDYIPEELVDKADKTLYQAKQNGRNQIKTVLIAKEDYVDAN